MSWYDDTAEKVIDKTIKLTGDKLNALLEHLDCAATDLPNFGYFPVGFDFLSASLKASLSTTLKERAQPTDSRSLSVVEGNKINPKKVYEFITYQTNTDLRDSESIALKDNIYQYFLREVKPHVDEAWINLDSVKIGYEISFNKYFYRHKPLRSLEAVAQDIIALEQKAEGLIANILGLDVNAIGGNHVA